MSTKKTGASEKNVRLIIELSSKIRQELKAKAALEGLNMKEVVTRLIEDYLINKNKNKKF
jgi:predicted DNA binding CopG/RHH family protein